MSDEDENEGSGSRRVNNLQGLLNFCTEVTAREDLTQNTAVELTEERRNFLENALRQMQDDIPKQIAVCLKKLSENCIENINEDISEQEDALDQLGDMVEDINYASDLEKMNGFPLLIKVLNCPHSSLQKRAAKVIGDICQNNNAGQISMLALDAMPLLLKILDSHNDSECKVKALYAISCLTRDCGPAEKQFAELSGFCYLMRAIQTKIPKLIIKSVFLLNSLVEKTGEYEDTLVSMGFIEQLVSVLFNENTDDISREYCTLSLLNVASSYKKALSECHRPEFQLVSQLEQRKGVIASKEEFQEEEAHITALLKLLEENGEVEEMLMR